MELTVITELERDTLAEDISAAWPRVETGEASVEEVQALALRVFDRLGVVGLDRWEKHHFVWVLKGLAMNRQDPALGLHTALHGVEQAIAPADARETPPDLTLDELNPSQLRDWVAAA